ncbi:MAG: laccase, partial [Rhodoferax sp.]|nr:laccase [Rhodoferax sp.]
GVLEATLQALMRSTGSPATELLAWLGPCIGPSAFEVGDEVRQAFVATQADAADCFTPHTVGATVDEGELGEPSKPRKWLADLPALARLRLRAAGLGDVQLHGNDGGAAWCTVGNASRFFSYRRDGVTGRMAACIWLG